LGGSGRWQRAASTTSIRRATSTKSSWRTLTKKTHVASSRVIDDDRFRFESVDATDTDDIARVLEGTDYVVNGLPYPFEENVLDAMQEVGDLTGVDLNAFDFEEVLDRSEEFAEAGEFPLVR